MPMGSLKAMALINGRMELSIKVNLKMESDMGMGNGYLDNKNMKVSMLMIGEMDKECTSGATKVIIKVIL